MTGGGAVPGGDRAAVAALSDAYAAAVDGRDGRAFAALFTPDGTLWVPRYPTDTRPTVERRGTDALTRVPGGLDRYHATLHEVVRGRWAVDGDVATGEVEGIAHHVTAAPDGGSGTGSPAGTDLVWFLRYEDAYARTAGGWRFTRRTLHLRWTEEHPVAVLGPPGPAATPG